MNALSALPNLFWAGNPVVALGGMKDAIGVCAWAMARGNVRTHPVNCALGKKQFPQVGV